MEKIEATREGVLCQNVECRIVDGSVHHAKGAPEYGGAVVVILLDPHEGVARQGLDSLFAADT
jgi:hypothetical protein